MRRSHALLIMRSVGQPIWPPWRPFYTSCDHASTIIIHPILTKLGQNVYHTKVSFHFDNEVDPI